jgi:hypothetical protein
VADISLPLIEVGVEPANPKNVAVGAVGVAPRVDQSISAFCKKVASGMS